ncbi:MAG: peptidase, partial [Gammaproteobacteria bacterium]
MTYCLAIKVQQGLVFCADSRTNAGPDQVSTYSKMHRFPLLADRRMVLLSAGNLATSQAVVAQLNRDIDDPEAETSLNTVRYISDAADYVGRLSLAEQQKYTSGGPGAGFNAEATFILGGQVR